MDPILIAQAFAIVILGGWSGWKEVQAYKERKKEQTLIDKYGLAPNPTRCAEHTIAINELKADVRSIKKHLGIV